MRHIKKLFRFMPLTVAAIFFGGCAVPPEKYVPTETVLVSYADFGQLLKHPQVEEMTALLNDAAGEDVWESAGLKEYGLTSEDMKQQIYLFISDWESEAAGIVIATEDGVAGSIFARLQQKFADSDEVKCEEIDGKAALVFEDSQLIAVTPELLVWLFGMDPASVLKADGANIQLQELLKQDALAAVQFSPEAFDADEELKGVKSVVVTIRANGDDLALSGRGVMESPELAKAQLGKLRGGLMLLNMMAAENPEADALFKQTKLDCEGDVITIDVPQAASAINAVLRVQAESDPVWVDVEEEAVPAGTEE